jgi:hypothetical protein
MKKFLRSRRIQAIAIILVIGWIGFAIGYTVRDLETPQETSKASAQTPAYKQDPRLVSLATSLNLDVSHLNLTVVDSLPADLKGEYEPSDIRILSTQVTSKETFSHEYLHYKWESMDTDHKTYLITKLSAMYQNDPSLQNRMKYYTETEKLSVGTSDLANEVFAISCTESSDRYLDASILANCDAYIDRSLLTFRR